MEVLVDVEVLAGLGVGTREVEPVALPRLTTRGGKEKRKLPNAMQSLSLIYHRTLSRS